MGGPAMKEMEEMAPLMDEGFVVPTQVSYVGKSGRLFEEGEKVPGMLLLSLDSFEQDIFGITCV